MSTKLQNYAAVAEIFSAAAVVITLIILVLEVRENTAVMRSKTRADLTQQIIDIQKFVAGNPDYRRSLKKAQGLEPLSEDEAVLLRLGTFMWFRHIENVHYQYRHGLYETSEYEAQKMIWKNRLRSCPWVMFWERSKYSFSPQMVAEIDSILEALGSEAGSCNPR